MRKNLERKLGALSYNLGPKLRLVGLQAELATKGDQKLILLQGNTLRAHWSQLYVALNNLGHEPKVIRIGEKFLLQVSDSTSLREDLAGLALRLVSNRESMVHLPGIGFEPTADSGNTKSRAKFLGPVLSLILALAAWFALAGQENESENELSAELTAPISCILEGSQTEFQSWLDNQLQGRDKELLDSNLLLDTEVGSATISVADQVGDAILVNVKVACDGRETKEFLFRADRSLIGPLVQLDSD